MYLCLPLLVLALGNMHALSKARPFRPIDHWPEDHAWSSNLGISIYNPQAQQRRLLDLPEPMQSPLDGGGTQSFMDAFLSRGKRRSADRQKKRDEVAEQIRHDWALRMSEGLQVGDRIRPG